MEGINQEVWIGLKPISPTSKALRDSEGNAYWRYCPLEEFLEMAAQLDELGVEKEFPSISEFTCRRVAEALDNNPRSIPEMRAAWRTSGGFEFGGFYTASEVDYLTQEAGQ